LLLTGNPCNENRDPCTKTRGPCNENRFFPVWKSSQGKPCSGPVLALYRIAVYTYRVLQTIQMKLILLCVWAEPTVLGSTKTALEFKYEI
jgi:hypothetical protein